LYRREMQGSPAIFIGVIGLVGLYITSLVNYLLFHTLAELFSIVIAVGIFLLAWNVRDYLKNNYLKLLGFSYIFIALLDLVHTLAFKGMNIFPGYDANLPTQLWIAARYLQAFTLGTASFYVTGRRLNDYSVIGCFATAASMLLLAVFLGIFPDCYIEGKGLTTFKIFSEYAITAILMVSLFLLHQKRDQFDRKVLILIVSSIVCTIFSEISFTAYLSVYGFANLVGHLFKVAAFYFIYCAIVVTGLKEPFNLIFRELKQAEDSLHRANETLEQKVVERTEELQKTNEDLFAEIAKRLHVESELRTAEERLRLTMEAVNIGIWDWDIVNDRWYPSPTYYSMLGYEPKIGASDRNEWIERVHPDDRDYVNEKIHNILTGVLKSYQYEARFRHADGAYRLMCVEGVGVEHDDDGKVTRMLGIRRDITETKQAEENIFLTNFALNRVYEAVYLMDEDAHLHYVNEEACRILGYSRQELLGLTVADIDPDFPMERWPVHLHELKTNRSLLFEGRHRTKQGDVFPVEINANYFEYNNKGYDMALVRDITERKRTEEKILTLNRELEDRVADRTAELERKNLELERINKAFVGRELRMIELKKKLKEQENSTDEY
jgi:PAS domain S-box-containing protein